jgi:single-stranded DNA-specific DHH superfamily exonuclease
MANVKETISPAIVFIETIKPKDKIAIVHGHDSDSICSAAIIYKLIKKLVKADTELVVSELNSILTEKTFSKIKKVNPKYTIIVDIPDISVEILTKLRNASKVLVIDHHMPKGYVKIAYVNPRIYDRESYLPATYLCYKIYEDFFDIKDILWIAGIGTLADMGMKNCLDLFDKIKATDNELVDDFKAVDETLIEKSLLGRLAQMIESSMAVKDVAGSIFSLKILLESKNYKDVLKNKTLLGYYKLLEKEFKKTEDDFNKNKKIIDSVLLYEIKSKLKIKSSFTSYIQKFFDDKVLVIYQKEEKYFNASLREGKNSEIDLDRLARESIRDIKDSRGGGHPQAAGCRVPISQFKRFVENLRLKMKLESARS